MSDMSDKIGPIEATWRPEVRALRARNDELRAEVERLKAENRGLSETIDEWQEIHGTFAPNPEVERLRALVQEHITVHRCLVCGSEPVRPKEC